MPARRDKIGLESIFQKGKIEMKKSFFLNTLLALVLAVAGWVLFSMYGAIPQSMCIPLPETMKSYNSPLYVTGRTVRNELIKIGSACSVAPGTYSSLGFFENGDIFLQCYYNDGSLYYGMGSKSFQFEQESKQFHRLSTQEYSAMIPMGQYKIALNASEMPALYHKETFYRPQYRKNDFVTYDKNAETWVFDNDRILEVLLDSEMEQTTSEALATLCWLTYTGRIRYWDPETNTAVFCTEDNEGVLHLTRYALHQRVQDHNITQQDYQRDRMSLSDYTTFAVISDSEFLAYSPEDKTVYRVDMLTGERETVAESTQDMYNLNYCYTAAGELVVGAQFSDNEVFWDYLDHEGYCYFPSDYKHIYYMSMNADGVWLIQADDNSGNGIAYSIGTHEVFRNAEK